MRRPERPESGETLIELLIAFAILAVITPAFVMTMIFTITSSSTFKNAVAPINNAGLILDNWSDLVDQANYVDCVATWVPPAPLPAGTTTTASTATVQYWDGSTSSFVSSCPSGVDQGLQLVTLTVTTKNADSAIPNLQSVKVVKRKPCLSGC